jgi:D-serine deaminase-like pyridoxal phosphate-dependent protein
MEQEAWYRIENEEAIPSPSLLVYPDRIEKNIQTMIQMVGDVKRLRPHIKTHKMAEVIDLQMHHGIRQFKCATIAEGELLGLQGAPDVLLAMQPVGANVNRFFKLIERFPTTTFSTIVDNQQSIQEIGECALVKRCEVAIYLDLNVGMNRTGIAPAEEAALLFEHIRQHQGLIAKGLHVYDGHIRNHDLAARKKECDAAFQKVLQLKEVLEQKGIPVPEIIAGGSPTFPIHAQREQVITSPGTTLLWDERYGSSFPEMPFLPAAVLLTRVISHPAPAIYCLDLGHKAIAPEMDFPRARIFGLDTCKQISQSEEHLVLQCPETKHMAIGTVCYAIPMHICPTVAKYPKVLTVLKGKVTGSWRVAARDHQLTI